MSSRRKAVSIWLLVGRTRASNDLLLCGYVGIFVLDPGHKRLSVWLESFPSLLRTGVFPCQVRLGAGS